MAQAIEAVIPRASQFILYFITPQRYKKSNMVAKELSRTALNFAGNMATISKKGSFLKGDIKLNAFGNKLVISRKAFFYTSFFILLAIVFYLELITINLR